jgi:phenol 2-monooxygenase
VQPAAGTGIDRPADLPDEVDVLIVGSGPAGMLLAAQLSQYPDVVTRIIERRDGRLVLGQADGIQPRSVETFQAFGFAERIVAEAYNIGWMNFWGPDPETRAASCAARAPPTTRTTSASSRTSSSTRRACSTTSPRPPPTARPHRARLRRRVPRAHRATTRTRPSRCACGCRRRRAHDPRAYVVGCDGARSGVREAIGRVHVGDISQHAWGVMDVLVETDFPTGASSARSTPRRATSCTSRARAATSAACTSTSARRRRRRPPRAADADRGDHPPANEILHPYTLDVKQVAWHSVYEVGHRVTDGFDDAPGETAPARLPHRRRLPHAQREGGPGHERLDAGRLQPRLEARLGADRARPASLLSTYGAERRPVAQQLIDFDKEWSSLMARKPEEISDPEDLATYYLATAEFPPGS